jgi:hypothetical protein
MSATLCWASQTAWVPSPVAAHQVEVAAQLQGARERTDRHERAAPRPNQPLPARTVWERTPPISTVRPHGQTGRFVLVARPYLRNCVLLR